MVFVLSLFFHAGYFEARDLTGRSNSGEIAVSNLTDAPSFRGGQEPWTPWTLLIRCTLPHPGVIGHPSHGRPCALVGAPRQHAAAAALCVDRQAGCAAAAAAAAAGAPTTSDVVARPASACAPLLLAEACVGACAATARLRSGRPSAPSPFPSLALSFSLVDRGGRHGSLNGSPVVAGRPGAPALGANGIGPLSRRRHHAVAAGLGHTPLRGPVRTWPMYTTRARVGCRMGVAAFFCLLLCAKHPPSYVCVPLAAASVC